MWPPTRDDGETGFHRSEPAAFDVHLELTRQIGCTGYSRTAVTRQRNPSISITMTTAPLTRINMDMIRRHRVASSEAARCLWFE